MRTSSSKGIIKGCRLVPVIDTGTTPIIISVTALPAVYIKLAPFEYKTIQLTEIRARKTVSRTMSSLPKT